MIIQENIQVEYRRVVKEKLPFEFIMIDSYNHLMAAGEMVVTRRDVQAAFIFIRQYRMMARRSEFRLQEGRPQPESFSNTKRLKELAERRYQKNLVKKILVSNWYFLLAEAGVNKLFLKLEV